MCPNVVTRHNMSHKSTVVNFHLLKLETYLCSIPTQSWDTTWNLDVVIKAFPSHFSVGKLKLRNLQFCLISDGLIVVNRITLKLMSNGCARHQRSLRRRSWAWGVLTIVRLLFLVSSWRFQCWWNHLRCVFEATCYGPSSWRCIIGQSSDLTEWNEEIRSENCWNLSFLSFPNKIHEF